MQYSVLSVFYCILSTAYCKNSGKEYSKRFLQPAIMHCPLKNELTATGIAPDLHGIPFSFVLPDDKTKPTHDKSTTYFEKMHYTIFFFEIYFRVFIDKVFLFVYYFTYKQMIMFSKAVKSFQKNIFLHITVKNKGSTFSVQRFYKCCSYLLTIFI
jgi:hypothetical protein